MTAPDTKAIRAQMEALAGHTMGPWHLCAHLANDDENGCSCGYRGVIYGPQREGYAVCQPGHEPAPEGQEGTEPPRYERSQEVRNARLIAVAPDMRTTILALCDAYEYSRLAVAHANDHADTAISDMQELRDENERLQAIIDNLHSVEEKHRETANDQFHRANRLQVEIERLTKERQAFEGMAKDNYDRLQKAEAERDEARAQVAAAYGSAASIVVTGEPEISPITRHAITALTPADASAAIEAYGREKMRAGMKRAADIAAVKPRRGGRPLSGPHHAGIRRGRSEAARLILADMEALK